MSTQVAKAQRVAKFAKAACSPSEHYAIIIVDESGEVGVASSLSIRDLAGLLAKMIEYETAELRAKVEAS